ncbi:GDSL-type esterase/lipase family protein [Actinomyces vulturis]|uniref:GDSL-type esterase/lipase family protein n=1 Tax=Actinomyces vulturis TaxID=1857645 RepID=UPI00082E0551|nr:GDSL-type esterase/lipase family protein [Actinomyces vulturis]
MEDLNVCFLGDELVAGYGDPRALGWTGRVMARTPRKQPIMWTTLAVPGETTTQMAARWSEEVARRSTHTGINALVIGVGAADVRAGISPARSRLALANILDGASTQRRSCFVVGPPPLPGVNPDGMAQLAHASSEVCQRRGVPYVDTFTPLKNHDQWNTDVQVNGGQWPGQAGYGLLAWLVLHRGWYEWLGLEQPFSAHE